MIKYKTVLLHALTEQMVAEATRQREQIVELLPEIAALRSAGKEFEDIAALLAKEGMRIHADVLRLYYIQAQALVEENRLSTLAERYDTLAEKLLAKIVCDVGGNTMLAVERALANGLKGAGSLY